MKKKITLIIIVVLLIISLVVGISYAYWRHTFVATNVNKIVSSCFNMEITNEKNSITLDDAYPITDEKGKSLTPYSFTITNTCDLFASYTINLEMLEGTTLNSKYIKTMINNEAITNLSTLETTDPSIEGAVESRILFKGSLGSGDSTDYTFRVWMDYDTPNNEESMNKSFQGKITVTAEVSTYSPVENGFTNLAEALLVNEYQTTSVDVAKNRISSKQSVDFTKSAPVIEWQEVHGNSEKNVIASKFDSSAIETFSLSVNDTKVLLGTSYYFDKSSGYYNLEDTDYYDFENVDFTEKEYYICSASVSISSAYETVQSSDLLSCTTLRKIIGFVSLEKTERVLSTGESLVINNYKFSAYNYTQTELESDKSDKGLYEALDDYGTTYYYRGNVTNNYVKFGGFYWRVIRINGDGSIRLLYAGTTPLASGTELRIGTSMFNETAGDPTYVGYMYSNTLQTSYKDTISNDNDSTIKILVDAWYKNNILDTGYSDYLADSGFCNDRSVVLGNGYTTDRETNYSPRQRVTTYSPTFKCVNPTNDLFTKDNDYGNKVLKYPIGLMTLDEYMYAGYAWKILNKQSYTYSSQNYWLMSPNNFDYKNGNDIGWTTNATGGAQITAMRTVGSVRPVINLKADTEISGGIGTKNDPFVVK